LIVNGHVPVKIAAGESPLKKSGMAVTIDGAFSEAYGDKGYTLILEPRQTLLALHHHFESVEDLRVNGDGLRVEAGRIGAVTLAGSRNEVQWSAGSPSVHDLGNRNVLRPRR
jgi:hypothetical protein